ncbi:MBL fold metallo-hydrolase, partial [Streptomyces sp. NPDC089915]|uniref:MBL fold metallo-hydrolase n=1 Tax=Streptomyces sp. NPDC089915 TaxID=3155186 RepID=UPI00343D4A55
MGQKTVREGEPGAPEGDGRGAERRKLDLSATQVAGSSLATVAAALLASKLGVYGTILGAGVVSVVATAGGPVIQHAFRRTGDRLREGARPGSRRLAAAGVRPEEVDVVVNTHLHADHVGWNTVDAG